MVGENLLKTGSVVFICCGMLHQNFASQPFDLSALLIWGSAAIQKVVFRSRPAVKGSLLD